MASNDKHDFRTCKDPDCPRPLCAAYSEGYFAGYEDATAAAAEAANGGGS